MTTAPSEVKPLQLLRSSSQKTHTSSSYHLHFVMGMSILLCSASLALALLQLCRATCDSYPIRFSGRTVDGSASGSCPSPDDMTRVLDQLERDLDRIIEEQLPNLQRFMVPLSCPGTGWMQLVDFNLESDGNASCPGSWTKSVQDMIPHCRISESSDCASAFFSLPSSVQYSEVCGRIKGYQIGPTSAFFRELEGISAGIESSYLDGVSLTHGQPRTHIWSFATGFTAWQGRKESYKCPCSSSNISSKLNVSGIVQDDYFCDSGIPEGEPVAGSFYSDHPLWDDLECFPGDGCCRESRYFSKTLPKPTCDPVEVRLCHDQRYSSFINIGVSVMELYVK